ncbi:hypothetical protein ID80_004822 [Salmonella enterica subsp. enterica serovar Ball]|nr:hypothetical protein [Salmonella enterica subsp. enterica serovar Minnesota]ECI4647371.1 hypothetical protein [Salmonella enterica subsp. salamae]EDV5024140.1 hypothetical protein [Salmonella enterica subsp. enterica serovar Ball]
MPSAFSVGRYFDCLLKKISVEAALNAEMSHHLDTDKNQRGRLLLQLSADVPFDDNCTIDLAVP